MFNETTADLLFSIGILHREGKTHKYLATGNSFGKGFQTSATTHSERT